MKKKKDLMILKAFVSLSLSFFFFLCCNPCFPLAYKRESRAPYKGHHNTSYRFSLDLIEPS